MREFTISMGLYTEEEVDSAEYKNFRRYCWRNHPEGYNPATYVAKISDIQNYSTKRPPSYLAIKSPIRRLVHRLIAVSVRARSSGREKVTVDDLFLLESMDDGVHVDLPFYVAKFLFEGAKGHSLEAEFKGLI